MQITVWFICIETNSGKNSLVFVFLLRFSLTFFSLSPNGLEQDLAYHNYAGSGKA